MPVSFTPAPSDTVTISSVSADCASVCMRMLWWREVLRSRSVSTMAPIIATSSTRPAAWNRNT